VGGIMEQEIKCKYCGCDASSHPSISIPLGSFTCTGGCGCYLIKSHVEKLFGGKIE